MSKQIEADVTCPRCGNPSTQSFNVNQKMVVYRGDKGARQQEFKAHCPYCGNNWVITVALPEDDK